MNASNRNLFALALATALLSPAALAQKGGAKGPPELPRLPPTTAPVPPEQTLHDMPKRATQTTEQATPPPSPPQSQGAEHATAHSSVVTRDLWARLDLDGDGKISPTEGAADAEFNADFATMDSNHDGYVTDTEYRTATRTEMIAERRAGTSNDASHAAAGVGDTLRRLDTNADGAVSLGEANANASFKSSFSAMDSNSDGLVTRTEYQAWLKANHK